MTSKLNLKTVGCLVLISGSVLQSSVPDKIILHNFFSVTVVSSSSSVINAVRATLGGHQKHELFCKDMPFTKIN